MSKPDREPSVAKSYRSIGLLSFMLKTPERLMNKFLREGTLTRPLRNSSMPIKGEININRDTHSLVTKTECSMQDKHYALG